MEDLTPREIEIVFWIVKGLSNKDIAERLCIKPKSVQGHLTRIFQKYSLKNRTQLAALARRRSWVQEEKGSPKK